MKEYLQQASDVLRQLRTREAGLSSAEAAKRLETNGSNKLAKGKSVPIIKQFFSQMADPMILILLAAALVSAVLAVAENESFTDVFVILFVVIINAILGVYQQNKAEKAIDALQQMAAATSKVLRDGQIVTVRSEDLVIGDVIILEAGDAVPADGRILECASLKIEEAALTGESVPVLKYVDLLNLKQDEQEVPLGDRKNMVYMGSTVAYGRGRAVITATGMDTEMGKIADALANTQQGQTPLQQKLGQLSRILTRLVLAICIVIFAVQLLRAGSLQLNTLVHSFMIAVSLAVAAIPEGLVAVVTIVLSIGVTNMSRRNAIIRRLTAVETLGCAQVICSDKTGTLTQNKMTVVEHFGAEEAQTAASMSLCSDAAIAPNGSITGEPTEAALVAWGSKAGIDKDALSGSMPRIGEVPFDSGRKMMSTLHQTQSGILQFTKGAPDVVLGLCTDYWDGRAIQPMTEIKRAEITAANQQMASRALRILACAQRVYSTIPNCQDAAQLEQSLCFIGLVGMIDPVRPEVKAAIDQCRLAGIRPIMITGDHVDTAIAIARELGILQDGLQAISGAELSRMDDETFQREYQSIAVYARVQPEHKTRIVNAWKRDGFVTAMTGDGVNDAPSIKTADIGVGMGITGTDVTKNVADMVLADDNFATIVGAVEEGRRIYDNIRKAIQFLLSSNMSEVLSIFISTLLGFTILEPVHLLWINLVTDCFPALALGMEKAEPGLMTRKPRNSESGIFAGGMGLDVAYQGLVISALTVAAFFIGHFMESGLWEIPAGGVSPDGTTMAFVTMSMAEIFHSLNMRSQRGSIFRLTTRNRFMTLAALGSLLVTTLVCEVPFLSLLFGFTSVEWIEYMVALALAVCVIPIVEAVKFVQRRKRGSAQ